MGEAVKARLCDSCQHHWVCMYRDELLEKAVKIDEILYKNRLSYELKCPDYLRKATSMDEFRAGSKFNKEEK